MSSRHREGSERPFGKRNAVLAILIVLALVLGGYGAKTLYHKLKTQRAEQFAAEGETFAQQKKWSEAANKYRAALQLEPFDYRALRGAAQLATRLNRPEAADLWEQVLKLPECTTQDRQEYAEVLVKRGQLKNAEDILQDLLKTAPDPKTLSVAAQYSQKMNDTSKAIEFMRAALNRAPADDLLRFQMADVMAGSTDARQHADARKILWELAEKEGPAKQPAVEALGRSPELSNSERERLVQLLDSEKSGSVMDSLIAADLQLQLHPERANEIYDQTIARWNSGESPDLLELARWLNLHQQAERVLSLYPIDAAFENDQLLLSRLDALATLQRWNDIDTLLTHPNIALDPSVVESFRARTAQERNSSLDADLHWNHAISLAGADPMKLRFVATFAEQSGATKIALKTYEQLAKFPEHLEFAYRGIQRLSLRAGDSSIQRAAAAKISSRAPDDPSAVAQIAYLDLLAGTDVDANTLKMKDLVKKYPERLSYRVAAALGFLRQNDPALALEQFKAPAGAPPIEWQKTPPAWRAIYAAALRESGQEGPATEIIATIPMDKLNPEERALVEPK